MRAARLAVAVGGCGALVMAAGWLAADTLVLRNGTTVEGELLRADRDTVEFRERGILGLNPVRRFDRDDVRRIDLDRPRERDRDSDRDRDRDRSDSRDTDRGRDRADSRDADRGRSDSRDTDRDRSAGRGETRETAPGRPSGLRERSVDVAANVAWSDTGVEVRAGQEVYFDAQGKITWGPGRRDDADGEGGKHFNAGRPIPSRAGGSLVGKVGAGSRDYFFVGKQQGPIRMPASGRLFLGINDDYLPDNSGGFRVSISY